MDDLMEGPVDPLPGRNFTVPEVAYIVDLSDKAVQREIDAGIVESTPTGGARAVRFADLLYFAIVREWRTSLSPKARADLRRQVCEASERRATTVRIGFFAARLDQVKDWVGARLKMLDRVDEQIVSRPGVRGGEPIVKGTRIPARLVAGLVRQGATPRELARDYELTPEQIEAAVLFDQLHPKRGRPVTIPIDAAQHVSADR
jgi:uncharacterized protein (DUF433 family)